MKSFVMRAIGLMTFLLATVMLVSAQDKDSLATAGIRDLINRKTYTFSAQMAMPLAGQVRQLTGGYELQVYPDKIVAYLPYFGRAYTAPIDPSQGGITFTSRDFNYTVKETKKNRWNIRIDINDITDARQMDLTVFSNGKASLQVNSNNRQEISFSGIIVPNRPEKKK